MKFDDRQKKTGRIAISEEEFYEKFNSSHCICCDPIFEKNLFMFGAGRGVFVYVYFVSGKGVVYILLTLHN